MQLRGRGRRLVAIGIAFDQPHVVDKELVLFAVIEPLREHDPREACWESKLPFARVEVTALQTFQRANSMRTHFSAGSVPVPRGSRMSGSVLPR